MKTLYIECNMGASGDMLMSALLELLPDSDSFVDRLNKLNIPGVKFYKTKSVKCGITGTHIEVSVNGEAEGEHNHEHHRRGHERHCHTGLREIEHIIGHLDVSDNVKKNAVSVYRLIADAEGHAHGCEISEIHFHEVGTMDAVADVVGVCMLFEEIGADKIIASPVNTGSGTVKCAHGILPVPAPATAYILRGVPVYSNEIKSELCTPTGAALIKHFAMEFGAMPVMRILKTGYGMGNKDFDTANCVRVMIGEIQDMADTVTELCCNVDDMTGEAVGFAVNLLFEAGALDVFTSPVYMKKNRPGIMLTCMCRADKKDEMLNIILKHTSTIGVREYISNRYTLSRTYKTAHTSYGDVRVKKSSGWGVTKIKAEHDDLEKIARENNIAVSDIKIEY